MRLCGLAVRVAVLCALLAMASGASYGEKCTKSSDCDKKAPYCSFFFTDDTYERNTVSATDLQPVEKSIPLHEGVCVECSGECDCGVNQYCGVDPDRVLVPWNTIQSNNDGNGANAYEKKVIEVLSKSFAGMKIRSKCVKYAVPKTVCKDITDQDLRSFTQVRSQRIMATGKDEWVKKVPSSGTIPKGYEDQYCGKINVFAPEFHEFEDLGGSEYAGDSSYTRSEDISTEDFVDTSAQCPKLVVFKGSDASCNACHHNSRGSISDCERNRPCRCGKEKDRDDSVCCLDGTFSQYYGQFNPFQSKFISIRNFYRRRCGDYPQTDEGLNLMYYTSPEDQKSYRSCSQACWPRMDEALAEKFDRKECYIADASAKTIADDPDLSRYCKCVVQCESCVASNGGCGKQGAGYEYDKPGTYQDLFGTCSGSCTSTAQAVPDTVTTPAPSTSEYPATCSKPRVTTWKPQNLCLPSCVDCLAKAMEDHCPNIYEQNACPRISPEIMSVNPGSCSKSGYFQTSYGHEFEAPVKDWEGVCEKGSCKICKEGATRCSFQSQNVYLDDYDGWSEIKDPQSGISQICVGGQPLQWYAAKEHSYGIPELNASLQFTMAATILVGACFLALLGVIITICLSKSKATADPPVFKPPATHIAPAASPPPSAAISPALDTFPAAPFRSRWQNDDPDPAPV